MALFRGEESFKLAWDITGIISFFMLIFGGNDSQWEEMTHDTTIQQEIWLFSKLHIYKEFSEFLENLKI